jgi:protein-S-isoprenylcysteine O-methyltransferase Ste14
MNDETTYRAVTVVLFGLAVGISSYYRWRADRQGGRLAGANGMRLVAVLRVVSLLVLLPLVGYLINPDWVRWARLDLPDWLRWLGAGGALLASVLSAWVFASIGTNISPSHATRQDHRLVTHGPYRWVRHPLYSVGMLLYSSLTLLTGLWWLGVGSLIPLALLMWRVPQEEARLLATFGAEYRAYMGRTGRFFPLPGKHP